MPEPDWALWQSILQQLQEGQADGNDESSIDSSL